MQGIEYPDNSFGLGGVRSCGSCLVLPGACLLDTILLPITVPVAIVGEIGMGIHNNQASISSDELVVLVRMLLKAESAESIRGQIQKMGIPLEKVPFERGFDPPGDQWAVRLEDFSVGRMFIAFEKDRVQEAQIILQRPRAESPCPLRDRLNVLLAEYPDSPANIQFYDGRANYRQYDELRLYYGWHEQVISRTTAERDVLLAHVTVRGVAGLTEYVVEFFPLKLPGTLPPPPQFFTDYSPELKVAGELMTNVAFSAYRPTVGSDDPRKFACCVYRFAVPTEQLGAVEFRLRRQYGHDSAYPSGHIYRFDLGSWLTDGK